MNGAFDRAYFAKRPKPAVPQDLTDHVCISLRLPTRGGLHSWGFEKNQRDLRVRVEGQLVFNSIVLMLNAALAGFGLAYLAEDQVQTYLDSGRPIQVLADWCPPFPGHHLYYPSRRQLSPAFAICVAIGDFVATGDDDRWIILPPRQYIQTEQWSHLILNAQEEDTKALHIESSLKII